MKNSKLILTILIVLSVNLLATRGEIFREAKSCARKCNNKIYKHYVITLEWTLSKLKFWNWKSEWFNTLTATFPRWGRLSVSNVSNK